MFNNKTIVITGGTGTWGQAITKKLLKDYSVKNIIVFSRSEDKQVRMQRDFKDERLCFVLGDIRDSELLRKTTRGVDFIIHSAALKHIRKCEENCDEAIGINIRGTQNIIEASIENNVKKVLYISTDKAVNPHNLYGNTKAISERLIVNANNSLHNTGTVFFTIRAGNILGSSGSVLEVFHRQISTGLPITVTDFAMNRFYSAIDEITGFLPYMFENSKGGEVYVPKCGVLSLRDLLHITLSVYGKGGETIHEIGAQYGEKSDEILISENEAINTYDANKSLYLIDLLNRNSGAYEKADFDGYTTRSAKKYDKDVARSLIMELFSK